MAVRSAGVVTACSLSWRRCRNRYRQRTYGRTHHVVQRQYRRAEQSGCTTSCPRYGQITGERTSTINPIMPTAAAASDTASKVGEVVPVSASPSTTTATDPGTIPAVPAR